ncbi:AAA family ATPase [Hymenobacter sp. ASUV-10]|uniref:AAA family ATPase n=1 Tax=Hymenobacter aranciens TaxID=3063996 RepID=A0ABT9BF59_9BACT|nr:ATP-binding protein [Hymenobacter sp. ASUV-10]MDO7875143.1 AAA family ATPase [Hymenobacter sp. ASUV-10]
MLTSLRIQNFRSIRDAAVKLGQVNLFIGPNNSGKTNFLKGAALFAYSLGNYPTNRLDSENFFKFRSRQIATSDWGVPIQFVAGADNLDGKVVSLIIGHDVDVTNDRWIYTSEFSVLPNIQTEHHFTGYYDIPPDYYEEPLQVPTEIWKLIDYMRGTLIYRPEPSDYVLSVGLAYQETIVANASNIVNFIYNLSQNYKKLFKQLEDDFARCVGSLTGVSIPADPKEPGKLKLKFFDKNDVGYWAEEVSEGVLYFLALLCIVHQPDPPKLLLLEEPEKGIHPRRIKEVMDFIFELARLRDIQIILTSHSPYVVDHFKDIPECVSVFDRNPETGETMIHNAGDLIKKTNEEYAAQGLPPTDYTSSLGEYWVSGFLGGVPL